jgi:flagella basal body P-ring formation protein FlgA
MNLLAPLLLCLAAFAGGGDEEKDRFEVRIKPTVTARGVDVTLGEICEITPEGAEALTLAQIRFGQAPAFGHTRTVSRTEIVQSFAAAGRDVATLKFVGAAEALIQPIVVEVPAHEILDSATAALQAVLALEGGDVEYTAPQQLRIVQAPPGRRSQELVAKVRGARTGASSTVVDVEIQVDGNCFRKVPITFQLTRYAHVLKTTGPVRAGTALGPENVVVVREPVPQGANLYLASVDQVTGLVAARTLQSDQRLMLADAAQPAAIHKGDKVTVVLTQGRVKVTAKALANHDAPLGGRITLTNAQSRAQMVGIVTAPGLVVVQQ